MTPKKVRGGKRGPTNTNLLAAPAAVGQNGDPAELPSAEELLRMPQAYLIRIPKRKDRVRAIVALLHVPRARCRFPDHRFLVTREHILALQKAGIPFEDLTDAT